MPGRRNAAAATGADTLLHVHVQPRASRAEVAGRHAGGVRIRLTAPPVDGAANEALVRFLADRLAVRRADVEIVAGATSRRKTVRIRGLNRSEAETIDRLVDGSA